jgi:iron only hydrogenase large subunit-like protein
MGSSGMTDRQFPIYTEENDCQDCYKCVRACPVKAIKIEDGSAKVITKLCVACGKCYEVCPSKAKKVRNDVSRLKVLLESDKKVIASIAPSWVSDFPNIEEGQMIAALKKIGFDGVGETALGAEQVTSATAEMIEKGGNKLYISSACPTSVDFIRKYIPDLADNITPIKSPMLAHAKLIKEEYGDDTAVVFIGPCISKKLESDRHPDLINIAITFSNLKKIFKEKDIIPLHLSAHEDDKFVLTKASEGAYYPLEGGMAETLKRYKGQENTFVVGLSGIENIKNELKGFVGKDLDAPVFVECLACPGGCINGPCSAKKGSLLEARLNVKEATVWPEEKIEKKADIDVSEVFTSRLEPRKEYEESEIKKALRSVGKFSINDELNCGGCGYSCCRSFAKALLDGKAEPEMCISYMRRLAQKKANELMKQLPLGVVIVKKDMEIIEYNQRFAELFDLEPPKEETLKGSREENISIKEAVPFHNLFSSALTSGQDITREHVKIDDNRYNIIIFTIEKNRVVGGIIQNVTGTEMKREQIAKRAGDVIHKNLATVQQIACTLGEHMAETEILLRSIVDDFNITDEDEERANVKKPIIR